MENEKTDELTTSIIAARIRGLENERDRLQHTVDHYAEMITNLEEKLKASEAAANVLTDMTANARGAEETLNHVLELLKSVVSQTDWRVGNEDVFELRLIAFADDEEVIREILDETSVLQDTDMLRSLRLRYCNEADKEALIEAGVIHE